MLALSQKLQQCKHGYLTGREAAKVAKRKSFDPSVQVRVLKTLDISYSHSMNRKCGHFHVVSYFIRKTNVAIHGDTQRHKSETKLL